METTITALEMRRHLGGLLDRVARKGEHITIMRGNRSLATLIPASEHQKQCASRNQLETVQEALGQLEDWQKKNHSKLIKRSHKDSAVLIRQMRDSRW